MIVFTDAAGEGIEYQIFPETSSRPHIKVTDEALIERIKTHGLHGTIVDGQIVIPTDEEIAAKEAEEAAESARARLSAAVQRHLDAIARTRNYDGILSLCTYATSTNSTFATEGQAGVAWRDAVWATCYQLLDEVTAGTRPVPTEDELIALLPAFEWPTQP